jgi:hypothetical protein
MVRIHGFAYVAHAGSCANPRLLGPLRPLDSCRTTCDPSLCTSAARPLPCALRVAWRA